MFAVAPKYLPMSTLEELAYESLEAETHAVIIKYYDCMKLIVMYFYSNKTNCF